MRALVPLLVWLMTAVPACADPGVPAAFDALAARHGGQPAKVRLVTENTEAWALRWAMLAGAQKSVDCTYFIIEDDVFGRAFLGAMAHRAREGVKVRLMIDARGSGPLSKARLDPQLLRSLASVPNVSVRIFNPMVSALPVALLDLRAPMASNHDKFLIVDGRWVVMGGRNISRNYLADPADNPEAYRDTDVAVAGGDVPEQSRRAFEAEFGSHCASVVNPLDALSAEERLREIDIARRVMQERMSGPLRPLTTRSARAGTAAADALIGERTELMKYPSSGLRVLGEPLSSEVPVPVVVLDSTSRRTGAKDDIGPAVRALVDAAASEIVIQNPYVVLSAEGRAALVAASRRGVAIRLYTNSAQTNNHALPQAAFELDLPGLLRDCPTLEVRMYGGTRLCHAKAFVFDRKVAIVGTYNLDPLAMEVNSEAVAVIRSSDFAERCALRIAREHAQSGESLAPKKADGSIAAPQPAALGRRMLSQLAWLIRPLL